VASAEPDIVPACRLDHIDLFEILVVGLRLEKFPAVILGVPWNFTTDVYGVLGIEKSKIHRRHVVTPSWNLLVGNVGN